jgi:hypothetical protein
VASLRNARAKHFHRRNEMMLKRILLVLLFLWGSAFVFQMSHPSLCFGKSSEEESKLQLTKEEKKLISLGKKLKKHEKKIEKFDEKVKKASKSK